MSARDELTDFIVDLLHKAGVLDALMDAERAASVHCKVDKLQEAASAEVRTETLNEAIQSLHQLWRLAPESGRADGINFAIGALMSVRDHPRATASSVPVPDNTTGAEEQAELTARARRVAVSHEHFIQDHDDPGTEALAAQYELINHLSRSADPGDLPLTPVETALRVVLAVLDETQDDASPREIRAAIADALPRVDMSDRRRRLYIDGKGRAWIDGSLTDDGTQWIACVVPSGGEFRVPDVIAETGSLREIGRCW